MHNGIENPFKYKSLVRGETLSLQFFAKINGSSGDEKSSNDDVGVSVVGTHFVETAISTLAGGDENATALVHPKHPQQSLL